MNDEWDLMGTVMLRQPAEVATKPGNEPQECVAWDQFPADHADWLLLTTLIT